MEADEVLTIQESMEFCRCRRYSFNKFVREAEVPACNHAGNRRMYLKSDLLAGIRRLQGERKQQQADVRTSAATILGEHE